MAKLSPDGVAMLLYKEMTPGAIRNVEAKANDASTGGGARDIRFGSYEDVRPALDRLFPERIMKPRKRTERRDTPVGIGTFFWQEQDGTVIHKEVSLEIPNDSRRVEARIATAYKYPCLRADRIPPHDAPDRVLLLLILRNDGSVWPHYTVESSLRTPGIWEPAVAREVLSCLDAKRDGNASMIGFYDLHTRERYCKCHQNALPNV